MDVKISFSRELSNVLLVSMEVLQLLQENGNSLFIDFDTESLVSAFIKHDMR